MKLTVLNLGDAEYPARLHERLGDRVPKTLTLLGNPSLLAQPQTALFCSITSPPDTIQRGRESAGALLRQGRTVISGFHSPVEKECLKILLTGKQPIIIAPLRALSEATRVPKEWRTALESGQLVLVSPFEKSHRPDEDTARRRNEVVAALADEIFILYAEPGGNVERISQLAQRWGIPAYNSPESMLR